MEADDVRVVQGHKGLALPEDLMLLAVSKDFLFGDGLNGIVFTCLLFLRQVHFSIRALPHQTEDFKTVQTHGVLGLGTRLSPLWLLESVGSPLFIYSLELDIRRLPHALPEAAAVPQYLGKVALLLLLSSCCLHSSDCHERLRDW